MSDEPIKVTLWLDPRDCGLRMELGWIDHARDFHEGNPGSFPRVSEEIEKLVKGQVGEWMPEHPGESSKVEVAHLVAPKGPAPTPERLAQRIHAAQATLAVLSAQSGELRNQLDCLADEWEDIGSVMTGPLEGQLWRLPQATMSALRAMTKADEKIDAALELTCGLVS